MSPSPPSHRPVDRLIWRGGTIQSGARVLPEETPVALTYDRATEAVMMATPSDLRDFALGFSLSEAIVARPEDIEALDIVTVEDGVELRMDLAPERRAGLARRRRRITGPGGCGLCGIDSLAEALRPVPRVTAGGRYDAADIRSAQSAMSAAQILNTLTHAVHAAAFWTQARGLIALREDVGRHNALDKLIGGLAWHGTPTADGILLLSSRVSVDMVQKAAVLGAPVIVAVSAPTTLAVRVAAEAGLTLVGVAREDGFEVFTHPDRIRTGNVRHVA
jgi:FdhD protein